MNKDLRSLAIVAASLCRGVRNASNTATERRGYSFLR
jgi:hypothetical protein